MLSWHSRNYHENKVINLVIDNSRTAVLQNTGSRKLNVKSCNSSTIHNDL